MTEIAYFRVPYKTTDDSGIKYDLKGWKGTEEGFAAQALENDEYLVLIRANPNVLDGLRAEDGIKEMSQLPTQALNALADVDFTEEEWLEQVR